MAEKRPCPFCGKPMFKDPIGSNKGRKTPVVSISPDGERTRYPSFKAAAKAINANVGQISRAVNFGELCRGMVWEKEGEDE